MRTLAAASVFLGVLATSRFASAQAGAAAGATAGASAATNEQTLARRKAEATEATPLWMRKMAGSGVDLMTFVGSGTFYISGYHDSYVASSLFLRPTYDLGTRFKLSANARLAFEGEYTSPDNPSARQFTAWDTWLWLSAKDLHTFESSKIRIGGVTRLVLPVSPESRYAHLLAGLAVGGSVNRVFDLGSGPADKQWKLALSLSEVFTKNVHSDIFRGTGPGDTTPCRRFGGSQAVSGQLGVPAGGESDHCGGPLNTSFAFTTVGAVVLSRAKWSFSTTLVLSNAFRYSFPEDEFMALGAESRGRVDTTWGMISVAYSYSEHLGISAGLSSFQPALDSRYRYPRFPFFDLSGGANANNFTQVYVGLTGTL